MEPQYTSIHLCSLERRAQQKGQHPRVYMAQMAYKKLVESGAEIHHAPDPDTLPQGLDPDRLQLVFGAYFGGVEDPNCVNRLLAAFKNSKNSYKARVYEPATLYIEHIL